MSRMQSGSSQAYERSYWTLVMRAATMIQPEGPSHLTLQEPSAKAVLLSALSPRARVHLLSIEYTVAMADRWELSAGETVIQPELQWLQPLKEYAQGRTAVRLICDEGAAKVGGRRAAECNIVLGSEGVLTCVAGNACVLTGEPRGLSQGPGHPREL